MTDSKPGDAQPPTETPTTPAATEQNAATTPVANESTAPVTPVQSQDRTELLARARTFLQSPNIAQQDLSAKRRFLVEKGLQGLEIDDLLRHSPSPPIPPRSYPQPPPSNLPRLLLGIFRLFSWITGGSAVLIFIYYRFLLPRITQTSKARGSLKTHHLSLLRRLNTSIKSLKESQTKAYEVLPEPRPWKEPPQYMACRTVADILKILDNKPEKVHEIPPVTLLRCGIADYAKGKDGDLVKPNTAELFEYLEKEIPWLTSPEAAEYEDQIYAALTACSFFTESEKQSDSSDEWPRWTYTAPPKEEPTRIMTALTALSTALPAPKVADSSELSPFGRTLQTLSDLTGYISTQVYIPYRPPAKGTSYQYGTSQLGPAEEEFRREIRALKGLALNRRSLLPSIPKLGNIPRPASTA